MNTKKNENKPVVMYDGATNFVFHSIGDVGFMFHYKNGVRMVRVSLEGQESQNKRDLTEEQFAALYYSIERYIKKENRDLVEDEDYEVRCP